MILNKPQARQQREITPGSPASPAIRHAITLKSSRLGVVFGYGWQIIHEGFCTRHAPTYDGVVRAKVFRPSRLETEDRNRNQRWRRRVDRSRAYVAHVDDGYVRTTT